MSAIGFCGINKFWDNQPERINQLTWSTMINGELQPLPDDSNLCQAPANTQNKQDSDFYKTTIQE